MIELIPGLPDNVVGIAATGTVSARDYQTVVIPAVEAALKGHKTLRILYQLGPSVTGFSAEAMWDDMKLGVGHFGAWERVAVVTDLEWVAGATRFFAFAMPCPVKTFSNAQLAEAMRWITEV